MEEIILISFCYGTVFCLCSYPLVKLTYNYFFPMSSKLNPEPPKEPPKESETDQETDQESESLYPDFLIESSSSDSETEDTNDEDYVETNIYTRKLRKRKRKT